MKKIPIVLACLGLLLTAPSLARESKVLGSTTITFVGAIVEGGCYASSEENTVKTSCWNGKEMVRPKDGDRNVIASGHMDVRDGILVVADDYNVDLYDGTAWHKIVMPYK